jgi:aspartyl-tRNA(Asn)/glutamyl-tRNA(Gln) amidotransferase subunit B
MRCDANVSLSGGAKVEIKNISSFKEVAKAISYEVLRQRTFSHGGREGSTETRHWDERRSITIALRAKEEEQDYRYFPEPDLTPIRLTDEHIARIKAEMPELPERRAERYVREYKIPRQVAGELAKRRLLADFFDESSRIYSNRTELANWIGGELRAHLERLEAEGKILPFSPRDFIEFLRLVEGGTITKVQAREVLKDMVKTGNSARSIADAKGLIALRDEHVVQRAVDKLVSNEPELFEKALSDSKAFNYLVGRVLKEEPKADPKSIARVLASKLKKR